MLRRTPGSRRGDLPGNVPVAPTTPYGPNPMMAEYPATPDPDPGGALRPTLAPGCTLSSSTPVASAGNLRVAREDVDVALGVLSAGPRQRGRQWRRIRSDAYTRMARAGVSTLTRHGASINCRATTAGRTTSCIVWCNQRLCQPSVARSRSMSYWTTRKSTQATQVGVKRTIPIMAAGLVEGWVPEGVKCMTCAKQPNSRTQAEHSIMKGGCVQRWPALPECPRPQ